MAEGDDREATEFAKCAADAAYFTHAYGLIDDAQGHGDGTGTTPFHLWPAQVSVMWSLMSERLTIILKARQLGISWLCCSYALWLCLFQSGKTVLLYSQGQDEANEMLRRIKVLHERLPEWLRSACPSMGKDNTTVVEFSNESRIKSLPATRNAGRSLTASLVILDEAAFQMWADPLYTALKPTIDGGGQLVILSTANGIGNLFHRLWIKASSGLNTFKTIFLPWWARPGRDQAWYAAKLAESDDPAKVKQEYPATANEAFLVSGRVRFLTEWIDAQARNVHPGLPRNQWPESLRGVQGLAIYSLPVGRPCVIGGDVAEGLEHGDYSSGTGIDSKTWEQFFDLHGHFEPDEFAVLLKLLSDEYGADILVERNNHGHAVISKLKTLGCMKVMRGHDGKRGWLTNVQTKPQVIDGLAVALRDELAKVKNQAALNEMQIYRILEDGKTGAPERYHDDRVMSWALAIRGAATKRVLKVLS